MPAYAAADFMHGCHPCFLYPLVAGAGQVEAAAASQQPKRQKLDQQQQQQPKVSKQQQERRAPDRKHTSSSKAGAAAPAGGHSSSKTKFYEMLEADGITAAAAAASGAASKQAFLADLRLEREMARKLKVKKVRASCLESVTTWLFALLHMYHVVLALTCIMLVLC
jgi:transcription initiation factor TFIID subunit TAF12